MKIVDNTASINYDKLGDDTTFLPAATFVFVTATKIITITDASVFPAGDGMRRMSVEVFDQQGKSKGGQIVAAAGNVAIDLDAATTLDMSGPVVVKATCVTTKGLAKDGTYPNVYGSNNIGMAVSADANGALVFEK